MLAPEFLQSVIPSLRVDLKVNPFLAALGLAGVKAKLVFGIICARLSRRDAISWCMF